ncbi:DUF2179 domain-containing protein [Granulicatella sp. zg-ZJ]|nr:DUF2179 domain-containing protein [Granulicatella sp. zg-ZJ]
MKKVMLQFFGTIYIRKENNKVKNISWKSLFIITLGNLVFAIAVNTFLLANHMGEGGVTGISLLLYYVAQIPVELSYFLINLVLMAIGYKYLEKSTIFYTIYSFAIFSVFVRLTSSFQYVMHDQLLVPIVGGLMSGTSIGFIIWAGGSTAGTDIIALIINRYFNVPTSTALFVIDLFIVGPSAFVIGFEKSIYTLIMLFVAVKVIDYILEGFNVRKSILIISEHHEEISQRILTDLYRGVTVLHGHGSYTKEEKQILYIVVDRNQVVDITKLVNHIDPKAFVTISDVHNVLGEGFTYDISKKKR